MLNSKKESLEILKGMMASFKTHIAEIEGLIVEAEMEILNGEKKVSLKKRIHEGLCRKIEELQAELAVAESENE